MQPELIIRAAAAACGVAVEALLSPAKEAGIVQARMVAVVMLRDDTGTEVMAWDRIASLLHRRHGSGMVYLYDHALARVQPLITKARRLVDEWRRPGAQEMAWWLLLNRLADIHASNMNEATRRLMTAVPIGAVETQAVMALADDLAGEEWKTPWRAKA